MYRIKKTDGKGVAADSPAVFLYAQGRMIILKTLGYYNGKYGELPEMSVPMNDRVCWFGDGVYDAGPARNYKILPWRNTLTAFSTAHGC